MQELKDVLSNVPEIKELIGVDDTIKVMEIEEQDRLEEVKAIMISIFTKLMSADKDTVSELVLKLKSRLCEESKVLLNSLLKFVLLVFIFIVKKIILDLLKYLTPSCSSFQ